MSKLTALQIKNQKEPCQLSDGKGLYYEFTETGVKRWVFRYKMNGKFGRYTLGRYPDLSLSEARVALAKARALTNEGLNPAHARQTKRQENIRKEQEEKFKRSNTFKSIALEWLTAQKGKWTQDHSDRVLTSLENDAFPVLGDRPIDSITPPDVLKVLKRIESRGSLDIAKRVSQRMAGVFRYAVQTGKATFNPAADMQGVIQAKPVEHRPAVYDQELSQLLRDITAHQKIQIATKLALQFTALTACRPGESRCAAWSEMDLENKIWNIPADRMKMRRPHIVPLSKQALAVLHRASTIFGAEGYVFPSVRDQHKPMSDSTLSKALRDMGYRGKATPHGFRSSFSTMAYESGQFAPEVIEKALAHEEGNKIKGAYNRAEYLQQRRALLNWWGKTLQALEHGAEIIPIDRVVNE